MELISRAFHGMVHRLLPSGKTETPEISRMDAYLSAVYKILVWEDPKISFLTLGVLHVLLWLIVQLELRFYGIVCIAFLVIFICDFYFERKDLKAERTASSDAMRQVVSLLTSVVLYLRALRKENPAAFCFSMCGIFLGLTVVARNVSGLCLAYLMLTAIFTGPLLISKIPPEYLSNVKEVIQTFGTNEGLLAESELLPFISHKDLSEHDPELDSLLTDKTADSVTNSLISGITSMPSYLDAEGGSLDGLEEEDLEFAMRPNKHAGAVSYTPGESSSDSDSDHKRMNFESSHFNRDSSSEDEQCYAKGLQFSEVSRDLADSSRSRGSNTDSTKEAAASILGNLTTLGSSLITVLKTAAPGASKLKDSDSDFEIIDSDEAFE